MTGPAQTNVALTDIDEVLAFRPEHGGTAAVAEVCARTYDAALRLHRARNGIVHAGETAVAADPLSIDATGSSEALGTARKVFDWYRVESDYPIQFSYTPRFERPWDRADDATR